MSGPVPNPTGDGRWLQSLTPIGAGSREPDRQPRVFNHSGMTPAAAARAYNRVLALRQLTAEATDVGRPTVQFVNDKGPTQPGINPEWKPPSDTKPLEQPGVTTPRPAQSDGTTSPPPQAGPTTPNPGPAAGPPPRQEPQQQVPQATDEQIPARIDPELVTSVPVLATMYNPDGTLKSNDQLGAEQSVVDMSGLPSVLAENRNGTTPLPGGGNVDKTFYVDSEGWHVETTVNFSDGTTVELNGSSTDVEHLPNGRSATTMSYGQASSDARDELARLRQAMLSGSQGPIPAGRSPLASGIKHDGDADQVIGALDLLLASPNAPVRIIKDYNGKIVSLSVLNIEGGEHVVVLNSGVNSFDQHNAKSFEFYRDANGVMRAPGGSRIIEIDHHFVLVDDMGRVIPTQNADVGNARIFDPAMNPTGYTHGIPAANSSSPFGYPAYVQPGSKELSPSLGVEMPNEPGSLRTLTEIPIPPGLSADKAYRVSGGGIVVVDGNGAHWATDPGSPPTSEEIVKAVTEEIFWLAVGEGVGYAAFRVGAKVVPKIFGRPSSKRDDTIASEGAPVQVGTTPRGPQHAADEVLDEVNAPSHTADASAQEPARIPSAHQARAESEVEPPRPGTNQIGVHTTEVDLSYVAGAPPSKTTAASSSRPDEFATTVPTGSGERPTPLPTGQVGGLAKSHNGIVPGEPATVDTIRWGTVRMEDHPDFSRTVRDLELAGYPLRYAASLPTGPRVVSARIVDENDNFIRTDQYILVTNGMRYLDLEHEIGHIHQLEFRFDRNNRPYTDIFREKNGGRTLGKVPHRPGVLADWQNDVVEVHNRLQEYISLHVKDVPRRILDEHAAELGEPRKGGWLDLYQKHVVVFPGSRGLKKAWADEHFPDMYDLLTRYWELRKGASGK